MDGVPVRDIPPAIAHMQNAPSSLSTMYRIYGNAIQARRAETSAQVGKRLIDLALKGDLAENKNAYDAAKFYLARKGGWNETNINVEQEAGYSEDSDESATDTLMRLLGKDVDKE